MPINNFLLPGAKVTTAYEVANSCRFNDGDSACMHKTPSSSGNRRTFTFATWIKKTNTLSSNVYNDLYSAYVDGNNISRILFWDDNGITLSNKVSGSFPTFIRTNRLMRDPTSWFHLVIAVDTTDATEANRVKIYVNGTQETSLDSSTYPSQNEDFFFNHTNEHNIGQQGDDDSALYFDGYLSETIMIDGQQLTPSSFGEFDEDSPTIFKPIDVSGLTFGTNGFYLDYEDSSNLGNDKNGGTDFTEVNLAATDQSTDTPTLNYSTFNPLDNTYGQGTFSEGNLKIVTSSSLYCTNTSTFNLTKGKWHFEVKVGDSNGKNCIGIAGATTPHVSGDSTLAFGDSANEYSYTASGEFRHSGSSTGSWGSSFTNGDIIGCAFDLDNNELFFYKNGTIQNSGTAYSITDPTSTLSGGYFVGAGDFASDNTSTMEYNFGSPSYSISSGNTDANGYGNFEYPVKSGHYAINSANLAEFG